MQAAKMAPITPELLSKLKAIFSDIVILGPESPEYEESIHRWFRAAERHPGAVICPESVNDVSDILRFSASHKLDIAVCGVGHNGRGNSVDDGLVIDLRKMSFVSVDSKKKTVTFQAAADWASVYAEAEKYNLVSVGGITPSVGVGGFILNGGYSWLNGVHGMGCDNLIAAEVVLGDGRIVNCSENENEDLFWAMRGAGSAFGIVTKFVLKAYEQKNLVWAGRMGFARSKLPVLVDVINKVMSQENSAGKAVILMLFAVLPDSCEAGIIVFPWYNGPEAEAKAFFSLLMGMGSKMDTMKMVTYSQSGLPFVSDTQGKRLRATYGGSIMAPVDLVFLESVFDDYKELLRTIPGTEKSMICSEFYNPKGSFKLGQKETAFSNRGSQANVFSVVNWTEEEHNDACWTWARKLDAKWMKDFRRRQLEDGVDERTRTSTGRYPNYARMPLEEYYGVNLEKIVSLKKKYDPGNVFKEYVNLFSD